jgi:hypothetical protein
MFAQFRIAWPLNWNAVFQSRGDTKTLMSIFPSPKFCRNLPSLRHTRDLAKAYSLY